MTDNFELIKSLLKFENEGDCYYLQLLRRAADDPKLNPEDSKKYHGNMHSRSIKDYFIRSIEHLDDVKDEIKFLCDNFNVRAYIRLNKRTYKHIALNIIKHITEQMYSGETYSSPYHMISSAAGKACCCGNDNKTWIVDLDKEYLPYEEVITEIIEICKPDDHKKVLNVIPTKSGKHLITKPFNINTFDTEWSRYCFENNLIEVISGPDIHKDNPTILYVP